MQISILQDIKRTTNIINRDIAEVLQRIKMPNDETKAKIKRIRSLNISASERTAIKKTLPAIIFQGIFSEATNKGLIEHSNIIVIDIDHLSGYTDDMIEFDLIRSWFENNKHVIFTFLSPSGDGLKIGIKIKYTGGEIKNQWRHKAIYKKVSRWFDENFPELIIDESGSDLRRLCYVSYDKDLYYNENAIALTIRPGGENKLNFSEPLDALKFAIDKAEQTTEFSLKEGNPFVFRVAIIMLKAGVSYEDSINIFLTEFLRKNENRRKHKDDKYYIDIFKNVYKNYIKEAGSWGAYSSIVQVFYWYEIYEKEHIKKIKINHDSVISFLNKSGYSILSSNLLSPAKIEIAFLKNNVVTVLTHGDLIQHLTHSDLYKADYGKREKKLLEREINNNLPKAIPATHIPLIGKNNINIIKDTKNICYKPFKNGLLKITVNEKPELIAWEHVEKEIGNVCVYKNSIIQRDFVEEDSDNLNSDFKRILRNMCTDPAKKDNSFNEDRFKALINVAGYLLHKWNDPVKSPSILFTEDDIDSDARNGGTGKSLFHKVLLDSGLATGVILDGSKFDPQSKFKWSEVRREHNFILFDEIGKRFKLDYLFTEISNGFKVERKGLDPYDIPFSERPKISIASNFILGGNGRSYSRRLYNMEITSYYNENHTPDMDLAGRRLLDWEADDKQWTYLDNFLVSCIQSYLKNGLTPYKSDTLTVKRSKASVFKFRPDISEEFIEFITDRGYFTESKAIDYVTTEEVEKWVEYSENEDDGFKRNSKNFLGGLQRYASSIDRSVEKKDKIDGTHRGFYILPF